MELFKTFQILVYRILFKLKIAFGSPVSSLEH